MIDKLKSLSSYRGKFAKGSEFATFIQTNTEFRNLLDSLAKKFLNKHINGCMNCFMDAYFELINYPIEKAMNKLECNFKLRAGALLEDVINYDSNLNLTNHNITDELALYHLKTNPHSKKFFVEIPENLDELLENYSIEETKEVKEETDIEIQSELNLEVETVAETIEETKEVKGKSKAKN